MTKVPKNILIGAIIVFSAIIGIVLNWPVQVGIDGAGCLKASYEASIKVYQESPKAGHEDHLQKAVETDACRAVPLYEKILFRITDPANK